MRDSDFVRLLSVRPFLIRRLCICVLTSCALVACAATASPQGLTPDSFQQTAQVIRATYEQQLFGLRLSKQAHYGLRMYRQTLDDRYSSLIWLDMARVASRLNYFAENTSSPEQIAAYGVNRMARYAKHPGARSKKRYQAMEAMPEYLYVSTDLLRRMARLDEYGLKHKNDELFRQILRSQDFREYVTDPAMIRVWSAQLANQAFRLRQLGEQDVVESFITAFRKTYPDAGDSALSKAELENKIYGMTHIILAASECYQYPVREQDFDWIFDYFRRNVDSIASNAKADIIAEVGVSFLLAGLDADPVVARTREAIQQAVNTEAGLVPSATGKTGLSSGEHRNVMAIILLDWRGPHAAPKFHEQAKVFASLPYGLMAKTP